MALGLTQPLTEMSTKEYFLGVKATLKSGSLSLLEVSGPLQASNGIVLPLPLPVGFNEILL